MYLSRVVSTATKVAAPASKPSPERAAPPILNASSNNSNASAEISTPLANASSAPVTRLAGSSAHR